MAENVVALNEPINVKSMKELSRVDMIYKIREFYIEQRELLITKKSTVCKSFEGSIPTNSFDKPEEVTKLRSNFLVRKPIQVFKELSQDFTLVVKHPALFTANLDLLKREFPCFALVRNPLAVLLSWETVNANVREGHMPNAEEWDFELRNALKAESDRLMRQLILLDWCFQQYEKNLNKSHIILYEEIIASNGKSLSAITKTANDINVQLFSENTKKYYDRDAAIILSKNLISHGGAYMSFYSESDIMALLDDLLRSAHK
jgi:hypothetical protein